MNIETLKKFILSQFFHSPYNNNNNNVHRHQRITTECNSMSKINANILQSISAPKNSKYPKLSRSSRLALAPSPRLHEERTLIFPRYSIPALPVSLPKSTNTCTPHNASASRNLERRHVVLVGRVLESKTTEERGAVDGTRITFVCRRAYARPRLHPSG